MDRDDRRLSGSLRSKKSTQQSTGSRQLHTRRLKRDSSDLLVDPRVSSFSGEQTSTSSSTILPTTFRAPRSSTLLTGDESERGIAQSQDWIRQQQDFRHSEDQRQEQGRYQQQSERLPSSSPRALKVAIPRLPRDNAPAHAPGSGRDGSDNHRVSHACEPCRSRKTKCSGERPVCTHCKEYSLCCVYADGKRDRAKRELSYLQERVDDLEHLLRQISVAENGDSATQLALQKMLQRVTPHIPETSRAVTDARDSPHISPAGNENDSSGATRTRPAPSLDSDVSDAAGKDEELTGEMDISADVGSTGSNDRVTEDYARDEETVNAGFFGKASDVAWIQRARREVQSGSDDESNKQERRPLGAMQLLQETESGASGLGRGPGVVEPSSDQDDHLHATPSNYHLNDVELNLPNDVDDYEIPSKPIADAFIDAYFSTVHSSFPLLAKLRFIAKYNRLYTVCEQPVSRRWRAMLNLIFAIGAKYSVLTRAGWCGYRDHLIYFARARSLSLDHGALWQTGDLEQVQVLSLAVLYLVISNHTNRAWFLSGLAIRYAQALGLHLRNDTKRADMSDVRKEQCVRIWWSVYSLERMLEVMTGRPSSIRDREVSAALPVPIDEDEYPAEYDARQLYDDLPRRETARTNSHRLAKAGTKLPHPSTDSSDEASPALWASARPKTFTTPTTSRSNSDPRSPARGCKGPLNSAEYFLVRTQLSRLSHKISDDLYNSDTSHHSWAVSQEAIASYSEKIEVWLSELPAPMNFTLSQGEPNWLRERLNLGMFYWGTMILIRRPGLCVLEGHIPNESRRSKEFNRRTAAACVEAASEMLKLIPDEPDPPALYSIGPWWNVLHHLIQASTVIMLELSFRAAHVPQEAARILGEAKKAVNWLRAMAEDSVAADRAWHLMHDLLIRVAPKVGGDARDLSRQGPRSPDIISTAESAPLPNILTTSDPVRAPIHAPTPLSTFDQEQAEAYFNWNQDQEQQDLQHAFEAELGMPYPFNFEHCFQPSLPPPPYHPFNPYGSSATDPIYASTNTASSDHPPAGHHMPIYHSAAQSDPDNSQMDFTIDAIDPDRTMPNYPPVPGRR